MSKKIINCFGHNLAHFKATKNIFTNTKKSFLGVNQTYGITDKKLCMPL